MNGVFKLVSYELTHFDDIGEVMIAKLYKETDTEKSALVGVKQHERRIGFAGTMDIHIYDPVIRERFKKSLGQTVTVQVNI